MLRQVIVAVALSLLCAGASGASPAVAPGNARPEFGTLEGAAFRIDVPEKWNGSLVVFFHGYAVTPVELDAGDRISPMFDGMLARGFAVIQSAYSATGWAVEEGAVDSERLRNAFVAKHGAPKQTFAVGMSMGGTLTVMAIESKPEVYAGALSLCGALEPSDRLMQRDFALLAAFDYYFPHVLGALDPVPPSFRPTDAFIAKVAAALRKNRRGARAVQAWYGVGDLTTLPDVIAFNVYEILEMQQRTKGNPFGNADLVYTGSGDDFALNAGVHRYRTDPAAFARMAKFYAPTGKLEKPFLALHDTGDPLVPAATPFEYALTVGRAGKGANFVQQFVNRNGHCVFTPEEIDHAFGELLGWVNDGKRPASGKLK